MPRKTLKQTETPQDSAPEADVKSAQAISPAPAQAEDSHLDAEHADVEQEIQEEERRRKRLLLLLLLLLFLLCCVCGLFFRYMMKPEPLPEMVPVVNVNYPPHYVFSIYGIDRPVGVALSPDGQRVYVAETGGERLIKAFDRAGNPLFSFAPPNSFSAQRSPVYLAVDQSGRVFVTDRLQNCIYVYDAEGTYLDTILSPELTLTQYVFSQLGGIPIGTTFHYSVFDNKVHYTIPGQEPQTLPAPQVPQWDPLGIRFDRDGNLFLTDVSGENHKVRRFAGPDLTVWPMLYFRPSQFAFGKTGQNPGEFLYPNIALVDSQNRLYVADGNNGRISTWDLNGNFLFEFGQGTGDGTLSLPRGAFVDERDRLHIVDAVGQNIKVYDVSGPQPVFLFTFGDWGIDDGLFNYPNDIVLDQAGRLYIADRENNRIQVWSY
jgi:DNA-binding beta-propeller fold protein YncE